MLFEKFPLGTLPKGELLLYLNYVSEVLFRLDHNGDGPLVCLPIVGWVNCFVRGTAAKLVNIGQYGGVINVHADGIIDFFTGKATGFVFRSNMSLLQALGPNGNWGLPAKFVVEDRSQKR